MYESDMEYAAKRLNDTVVKAAGGYLFLVDSTFRTPSGRLAHHGHNLRSDCVEEVYHSDLDLTPIPLGMVNLRRGMAYVTRKPMRRNWRQGLSEACMVVNHFSEERPRVPYKLLSQPLEGSYPTFRSALVALNKSSSPRFSKAFSRDFGLEKVRGDIHLIYKQYRVGIISGGVPVLSAQHTFLQQHLQEILG